MDSSGKFEDVKKIAVLRAGALGDLIVTLPAFHALRKTYPQAEIVLLGEPWQKKFLVNGRADIDRVVVVPELPGVRSAPAQKDEPVDMDIFFNQLRQERFDIAISFQGKGISANPFLKKAGAKITVGTWCPEAETLDRSLNYYYYQPEVMRYLEIVRLAGASTPETEPKINIMEEDRREAGIFLSGFQQRRFVLLNPLARDVRRMWPVEHYTRLADLLIEEGIEPVFTGALADRALIQSFIIDKIKSSAVNVCGISFGGLAALASEALLMICPDTGPLHLAQAVECPTVGIYWAPNLINWGPLFRDIHRPVISWNLTCPYCGVIPNNPYPFEPSSECSHEVSFVNNVTVTDVMETARPLLTMKKQRNNRRTEEELIYNE
jgi:ADP-heptose:LPS heptosyltransferase